MNLESKTSKSEQKVAEDLASRGDTRSQRPNSTAFTDFLATGWAELDTNSELREVASFTPQRRDQLVEVVKQARLVLPAGNLKVRSNDTDYQFRPHTAFAYYSGLSQDEEPDSVFVVEPEADNQNRAKASYFFRPRSGPDTAEFYADARYGEMWVGRRPTLAEAEAMLGVPCYHIDELKDHLSKDIGPDSLDLLVIEGVDPKIDQLVQEIRTENQLPTGEEASKAHSFFQQTASEARLIKDEYELKQMQLAVDTTIKGFHEVVKNLPAAVAHDRGERVIETVFNRTARADGNGVGYDTIAAAGDHACTLHWIRNDGQVKAGDLVLIDAGAEVDSLYTADITRTLPVNGKFNPTQRKIYQAVLEAADAAFAAAKPGVKFKTLHETAMEVIAKHLEQWGLLPVSAEESLKPEGQYHRRWMVHGTSHHLGMDVHDCAQARREMYLEAELAPGMCFTIEPGLYFKENDLLVPPEFRGIGVRIEDDIVVTNDGAINLSSALPREIDDIEAWMAQLQS